MSHPHVKVEDKDHGWKAFFERIKEAKDAHVKVGVLADDKKGEEDHGGLTTAELAAVLHFGAPHIPPRPFLSMAFDQQRQHLVEMAKDLLGEVIEGKLEVPKAIGAMGLKLATEAKKVITIGDQLTPNTPETIKAKGSSRPLVDTGRLLGAITWAVDTHGGGEHGHGGEH